MLINLHDTEEGEKRTVAHYVQFDLLNHDSVLGPSKKKERMTVREKTPVSGKEFGRVSNSRTCG